MGGELRVEARPRRDQPARAGHVAEIGHRLAREDRVIRQPTLLRALDLGVPIGAFDKPNHQAAAERAGDLVEPFDHRAGPLLIGLHRQPEAVPATQGWIGQGCRDHLERELEPVGLLGIHREVEIMVARLAASAITSGTSSASTRARETGSKRGCSADNLTEMPGRSGKARSPASAPMAAIAAA